MLRRCPGTSCSKIRRLASLAPLPSQRKAPRALRNAEVKTICVVIRYPRLDTVVPTGLNHNVITFSNEAVRGRPDLVANLGTQCPEDFGEDGLLPVIRLGSLRDAGNSPAEVIGHAVSERLGIASRQLGKNVLH